MDAGLDWMEITRGSHNADSRRKPGGYARYSEIGEVALDACVGCGHSVLHTHTSFHDRLAG